MRPAQATANFSQNVGLFGHSRIDNGVPIHLEALAVYDLTDDRVVTFVIAQGESAWVAPPELNVFNATAGHTYHFILSNCKTKYIGTAQVRNRSAVSRAAAAAAAAAAAEETFAPQPALINPPTLFAGQGFHDVPVGADGPDSGVQQRPHPARQPHRGVAARLGRPHTTEATAQPSALATTLPHTHPHTPTHPTHPPTRPPAQIFIDTATQMEATNPIGRARHRGAEGPRLPHDFERKGTLPCFSALIARRRCV